MPLAIKRSSSQPNKSVTFDFPDTVLAYVVGVSYWKFSFGSDDHHVKTVALSLDTNHSGKQITTTITAKLDDQNGHSINNGESLVDICCIAVTSASDGNIALTNANGIPSDSSSSGIDLPGSTLSIGSAFLSGYALSHDADHHLKTFQVTAGFKQNGSIGQITSQAQMIDSSGNFATGSINGGLVAASTNEMGIFSNALTDQQTTSGRSVDFGRPLAGDAAVMLQSLRVTFGSSDHHVKTIGGGCSGWKVEGNTVKLDSAFAFISDGSSHVQDDNDSNVSLIVFALPA